MNRKALIWPLVAVGLVAAILQFGGRQTLTTAFHYICYDFDSSTQGIIIKSESVYRAASRASSYTFSITYKYAVEGAEYQSSMINGHDKSHNVDAVLFRYKEGDNVTVYFSAKNPSKAVLEKSGLGLGVYLQGLLLGIVYLIVLFWCLYVERQKANTHSNKS